MKQECFEPENPAVLPRRQECRALLPGRPGDTLRLPAHEAAPNGLRFVLGVLATPFSAVGKRLPVALLAATLTALSAAPAWAQTPPFADIKVHKQSGINYVSGGTTEDERKELARIANKYPMQLMFTLEGHPEGATGVKVTVKDLKGDKLIETVAEGPYFFFNPPSSRWTMDAEFNGETVTRTVDLIGRRYIVLEFKFGTKPSQ